MNSNNNLVGPIINALPYSVYIVDYEGKIQKYNKRAENFFDIDKEKLVGYSMHDFFEQEDYTFENGIKINKNNNPLIKVIEENTCYTDLIVKKVKNHVERYISLNCSRLMEGDVFQGVLISFTDVTEKYLKNLRIKKEREQFISISTELKSKCDIIEILRKREKEHLMHLKDVIDNISEGLLVLDSKGNFSFSNRSFYSILEIEICQVTDTKKIHDKYKIEEIDGTEIDVNQNYFKYFNEFLKVKDLVLKFIDREYNTVKYIEFNSNPIVNKQGELLYTIITIKDITKIKEHEIFAEDQATFVKDVVNNMDIPMAVIDYPSFKTKLSNKKFDHLISHILVDQGLLEDKNIMDKLLEYGKEGLLDAINFCGTIGREFTCSPYAVKDLKGNDRFYKIKIKPYKDKVGTVTRVHVHASDITEEINHSMELEKITRLKDEFFTVISHELRTPLTIIYSSLQLANNVYAKELTPNINKTLYRISQNCSRLLKLINNILDISKAEAGFLNVNSINFDIVSITELIVTSVNSYAKVKGIDLIFDTNEEEAEIILDRDKYEKILLNLLSNAVKFTPEGKRIMVQLNIQRDYIGLTVKDEGIGIPEDKISYIFDRFAQVNSSLSRRAEGTGLGLSLVKKLVELMEGEITVKSHVEKGSEFVIKFHRKEDSGEESQNYAILSDSMNDRINIEFSDVG